MRIRRTGAGRGRSPVFYVQAEEGPEREAIKAGLLQTDPAVDGLWPPRRFVLAYGFGSQAAAEKAMAELQPRVDAAVEIVQEMGDAEEVG